jgi:hypothetical protein
VKIEPSKLVLKLGAYPNATGGKMLQLGSWFFRKEYLVGWMSGV